MGPSSPLVAVQRLGGLALMSTHPRDFGRVLELAQTMPQQQPNLKVVSALGVHPWWLADLTEEDWEPSSGNANTPQWLQQMETLLLQHPNAIVGEIGLDGFHFHPETRQLVCPMNKQIEAFTLQLQLAARTKRSVSIHTVQCFGPLMETLSILKKQKQLPSPVYFHAFGGKVGTVDQVLALCGRKSGQVYFGFAPVVNFRSPKTAEVMKKVGLERLVLETDHEDAAYVEESMQQGIAFIAETFGVDETTVIETTTRNAYALYGLS